MNNKEFSTRDIYVCATLMSLGFQIDRIDYQVEGFQTRNGDVGEKMVGYFTFNESVDAIKQAEKDYFSGKLAVEPKNFITNLKGIRAQLANSYKNPNTNI
jgi:hypothetical protein